MTTRAALSLTEARAVVLRAQGFGVEGGQEPIEVLERLGVIQLDSVNVLARSHELVTFSRIGRYAFDELGRAIYAERRGFEYWGHMASWLPLAEYRYFIPRMEAIRRRGWWWGGESESESAELAPLILERIRAEGPLSSAAFADPRRNRGTWWDWKPAKHALESLFARGELMAAGRTKGFARLYDLPERVLPAGLDVSNPGPAEATRHLVRRSVAALGVATGPDAADYYRLAQGWWLPEGTSWKTALRELIESGQVVDVAVEGWTEPAYATVAALDGALEPPPHRPAFLTPFDNLVWHRRRTERLFDFFYQLEIYVPAPKRRHGYYVLPLLADGALRGRADLKLDRATRTMLVRALYLEGATPEDAASALRDLAAHLGAARIAVERAEPEAARTVVEHLMEGHGLDGRPLLLSSNL